MRWGRGLATLLAAAILMTAVAFSLKPPHAQQFTSFSTNEEEEGERPDHPYEAMLFRSMQQQDEHGRISPHALLQAASHRDLMVAAARARGAVEYTGKGTAAGSSAVESLSPGGIGRNTWTALGPGNIGGRIRSIVIHPTDPQTMWVGSATGGIFKTTTGGTSWAPLDDFMANLSVSTLVSPSNTPNVMYAGTGELLTRNIRGAGGPEDANRGAGIFKSETGGASWSQLSSTNTSDWWYVNRLAIDPNAPETLLAATWSGIWRTENGGTGWTNTYRPQTNSAILDVDFDPSNSNNAIAGGYGRVLYSTNGGQSWAAATGITGGSRVEVAYARSNPLIVYASVNQTNGSVYRSADGGHTYVLVNNAANYLETQGDYDNALWVSPTNANTIVVGGIDLWRSTDGGSFLTKISDWAESPSSAHADHHAIVSIPGYDGVTNRTVFFGNDGGIYKAGNVLTVGSPTLSSGWQGLNNHLALTQFYGAAANNASGKIVGGTQDNGTLSHNNDPDTWTTFFGGDGGFVAADQTNSNYFYGEYVYGAIFRSTDGAQSKLTSQSYISGVTSYAPGGGFICKATPYQIPDVCSQTPNFIAPFMLDPNNANRILVGGQSLWRTNDARTSNTSTTGPSWASIKPALTNNKISAMAIQSGNSDVVYVGYNSGLIYKSVNATAVTPTWTRVDLVAMPARMVLRITIDPTDPNIVYATFGGFSADNVWRSPDGGTNWSSRVGSGLAGLPQVPVRTLAVNAINHDWIYVGTEIGVFVSEDAGQTWAVPNSGPANVPVDELFWRNADLVAATFGRGLFTTPVNTTPAPPNDDFASAQVMTGTTVTRAGDTNEGATKQAGEQSHAGNVGGASIWYRWTPTGSGQVTIDTFGSNFDTLLAVYTGSSVGLLTPIVSNDDTGGLQSQVSFTATAGTTYQIAVDGYNGGTGALTGSVTLHLAQSVPPRIPSDFNGDGRSDIMWRNAVTGEDYLWFMNGTQIGSHGATLTLADTAWKVAGTGDFNGDAKADIVWRNSSTGEVYVWLMNGTTLSSHGSVFTLSDQNWKLVGTGDFNGDGKSDLLWRNAVTGENYLWFMNGTALSSASALLTLADLNWKVSGTGDFNGDAKSDIVWRNASNGQVYVWLMNGAAITSSGAVFTLADPNWKVAGTGDYDGDGKSDLLWRNDVTGENYLWFMNGTALSSSGALLTLNVAWKVAGTGDYDGNGKADIVWRNSSTGEVYVWLMNGTTIASHGSTFTLADPNWEIVPSNPPAGQAFGAASSSDMSFTVSTKGKPKLTAGHSHLWWHRVKGDGPRITASTGPGMTWSVKGRGPGDSTTVELG
jgi:photosystem II stability/assembly factor-like uncharacterized protein